MMNMFGQFEINLPHNLSNLTFLGSSNKLFLKANNPKKNLFIDEAMHNNLYDFNIDKEVIEFNSLI